MMKRVIEERVCDRCGKTYDPEPYWEYRGSAYIGKALELLTRPLEVFHDRGHNVRVRLYYVSHCAVKSEDGIVDLCGECKDGLADWFNAPRLECDA